jgi:glycine C-acetyltransferase
MNRPQDPFNGYFNKSGGKSPSSSRLLNSSSARRLLDAINWGSRNDLYLYQQAFEKKSGLRVHLGGRPYLMISSYDYLGLIGHPAIESASIEAIKTYGTGTGGVRLLTGTTDLHRRLDRDIAVFKGAEAAVTFSSGYLANLATLSTLLGVGDRIIIDTKAHRSIVEACRLAKVPMDRFDHNDPASLEKLLEKKPRGRRTLIIIEGIYSMDGDICRLPEIIDLKRRYDACLMVDEAHSFGVLGPKGRGVDEHFGSKTEDVDIWMGSLSKAVPSNGGFIAGSRGLVYFLQHAAAPFIFSAAPCPAAVAASREALRLIDGEPERLNRLRHNAEFLRHHLKELGFDTGDSESPVIPVILGDDEKALRLARRLFSFGIIATPIIKPAVSPGGGRLRLCATAAQDESFLLEVVEAFRKARIPRRSPKKSQEEN